jgi:hypothetical protein
MIEMATYLLYHFRPLAFNGKNRGEPCLEIIVDSYIRDVIEEDKFVAAPHGDYKKVAGGA